MPKLITILGPTASGKSSLGIKLAQEFNGEPASPAGEIISADSRQVYRGLDIGTGKVTPDEQKLVPHHLLDIVDPMADFSLAHFQKLAFEAIDDIIKRGKIPFLVGGTALYIYSVVDNYNLSDVEANPKRRKELEKMSVEELQSIYRDLLNLNRHPELVEGSQRRRTGVIHEILPPTLKLRGTSRLLNPVYHPKPWRRVAQDDALNTDDYQNPRRLIRAIEKLEAGAALLSGKNPPRYDSLLLGIDVPREELYKKIDQRVDERLKQGMIEEVENLRRDGVSDGWLVSLGLEYRFITEYLLGKYKANACQPLADTKDEMIKRLKGAIHAFARRQLTWWKRDQRIIWIKNLEEAQKQVKNFLE